MEPGVFFDLEGLALDALFSATQPVWEALNGLKQFLSGHFRDGWPLAGQTGPVEKPMALFNGKVLHGIEIRPTGPKGTIQAFQNGAVLEGAAVIMPGAYLFDDRIILGAGTVVEPGALIKGPLVMGEGCEVRQGAYIRGDCWVGNGCVVGHTTEIKGSIMLHGAKAGHFA